MTNGRALARLQPSMKLATVLDGGALRPSEQLGLAEIAALNQVDVALPPEQLDLGALEAAGRLLEARSHTDDLRLPPPPVQARDGSALFAALTRAVDTFQAKAHQPVAASEAAVLAEGRMMSLFRGLQKLQLEIHDLREQRQQG